MERKTVTAENGKEYTVAMEGDGPRALVFSARMKARIESADTSGTGKTPSRPRKAAKRPA